MTDETETASADPADNHVAPPQLPIEQARAIAEANEVAGFPTPPAVQAVIDAADVAKPRARQTPKPAAPPAGDA